MVGVWEGCGDRLGQTGTDWSGVMGTSQDERACWVLGARLQLVLGTLVSV